MPRKNTVEVVETELELDEDLNLQEKGWVIQRVGWVAIIAVMIAGALGVFGGGIISRKKLSAENFKAEYERFFRYDANMKVRIQAPVHISSITVPQDYLKDFEELRFLPEPSSNNTINNEVRYNFLPEQNLVVTIYLKPKTYGTIKGILKVNEKVNFNFNHFIYP